MGMLYDGCILTDLRRKLSQGFPIKTIFMTLLGLSVLHNQLHNTAFYVASRLRQRHDNGLNCFTKAFASMT